VAVAEAAVEEKAQLHQHQVQLVVAVVLEQVLHSLLLAYPIKLL